ncbi:hypothetical protein GF322_01620 [Candidatus Dependentiae bacterium]|nr:hypothetical protein [Candidatus Dependentiae bacterium]
MFTLILFLNFILLFFLFTRNDDNSFTNFRLAFTKALISIFLISAFFTEVLSFLGQLNFVTDFSCWLILSITLFVILFFKKNINLRKIKLNDQSVVIFGLMFLLILVPLFFQGLYYPPNNSDSLGYHLPRIAHWIQNNSLNHYLTGDFRQLYTPPLSEFVLLHLKLLAGSDLWFYIVQFSSMLGSMFLISLIVELFGFNYKFQILSCLLVAAIPMGILQSTTTQTDYLAAFLLCVFIFFSLRIIFSKMRSKSDFIFSGIALGLGFFTKATMAIFSFPFLLWLLVVLFIKSWKKAFYVLAFFIFIILMINFPFWIRNYNFCGNFLGPKFFIGLVKNETINAKFLISNLVRNISMHMAFPFANRVYNKLIDSFHEKILGISTQEKPITFGRETYEPFFCIDEDRSGNFFFIFILFFCLFYFLFNLKSYISAKRYNVLIYLFCLLSGYLLFSLIFKWQPWITRLDLPFFVISVPIIVCVFKDLSLRLNCLSVKAFYVLLILLGSYWMLSFLIKNKLVFATLVICGLIYYFVLQFVFKKESLWRIFILCIFVFAIPYVFFNKKSPILGNSTMFYSSHDIKFFHGKIDEYNKYVFIADVLNEYKVKNIFIEPCGCINEYWLWIIFNEKLDREFFIKNINENIGDLKEKFCAVISYIPEEQSIVKRDELQFSKFLGTERDPLSLFILRA